MALSDREEKQRLRGRQRNRSNSRRGLFGAENRALPRPCSTKVKGRGPRRREALEDVPDALEQWETAYRRDAAVEFLLVTDWMNLARRVRPRRLRTLATATTPPSLHRRPPRGPPQVPEGLESRLYPGA